jgi:soluble lytic murein transglycosylase-like protein
VACQRPTTSIFYFFYNLWLSTPFNTVTTHTIQDTAGQWARRFGLGLKTFAGDIARGFINISHHSFALLGLLAVLLGLLALARPEIRVHTVQNLQSWLYSRLNIAEPDSEMQKVLSRVLASPSGNLTPQQQLLLQAVRSKYRVAAEPLNALLPEVFDLANRANLDPTLILAVIGVESNFNPFARSPSGASGLMQVVADLHSDQFTPFGGSLAIFDPKTNLRIGVKILKDCIDFTPNLEDALRLYKAGEESVSLEQDYISRVLLEQARLQDAVSKLAKSKEIKSLPNAR